MWTGHFAASLVLKTLTPEVPLGFLFFAAALPDFFWLSCMLLGLDYEYITLAKILPGTFTYITHCPFSHSLFGNIILALLMGGSYYTTTKSRVGATSVLLATLSHFPLEIPGHRHDMRIFPSDSPNLGYGLFDSSLGTFLLEGLVLGSAYVYYLGKTSSIPHEKQKSEKLALSLGVLLALEHTLFSFNFAPTENVRFVHVPMFMVQVIATSLLAQLVDNFRMDRFGFWAKAENFKNNVNTERYLPMGKARS